MLPSTVGTHFFHPMLCRLLPWGILRPRGLLFSAVTGVELDGFLHQYDSVKWTTNPSEKKRMKMIHKSGFRYLSCPLSLICLTALVAVMPETAIRSNTKEDRVEGTSATVPKSDQTAQRPVSSGDIKQSKEPSTPSRKPTSSTKNHVSAPKDIGNESHTLLQDKKTQQAMSLIEEVLARGQQTSPVEIRILAEVEAATLLWFSDNERATPLLKNAVKSLRDLIDERKASKTKDVTGDRELQRIQFLAIRKIAALKPELVKDLSPEVAPGNKTAQPISGEWTEEARAIMSVASDQIEKDPKGAARLAEQSLRLGLVDWTSFLGRLAQRDSSEAERLAILLIDRLRDSPITPIFLQNLNSFILAPDRSTQLREHFFEAAAIRLRRDIRRDSPASDLRGGLIVAREMSQLAAAYSPRWQSEFDGATSSFEALFNERSLPIPGSPGRKIIDVSSVSPAAPGDTQAIADALPRVGTIKDLQARDKEYQKLAAKAAINDDISLAGDILAKINDEEVRRETTVLVYSPLVRRAIDQSDWSQAQKQASNISDPLGRTLVFDSIVQAMSRSGEDKPSLVNVYCTVLTRLENEWSTEGVAKGFLIVARALFPLDAERSVDALKSAILVLNRGSDKRDSAGGAVGPGIAGWVRLPNYSVRADEVLDLRDLIGQVFKQVAKRDADNAVDITDRFADHGLRALARLAICSVLLEEARQAKQQVR